MRVLISGGRGMLATDLVPALVAAGHTPIAFGHADLDVTRADAVAAATGRHAPDAWINLAAMTAVDDCETQVERAFAINERGARNQAEACRGAGIPLLHVSTDYVFDGRSSRPYPVDAPTEPRSVYGQSKLAGEGAVREAHAAHFIVRTSWLYGRGGKNFVDTMRRLGREKPALVVVNDQVGSPTWTVPLAEGLVTLLATSAFGTYHLAGSGCCTWYDLTCAIMDLEGLTTTVRPTTTAALGRPAPRPAYSVLDCGAAVAVGVAPLPAWQDSLAEYMRSNPASVGT